MKTAIVSDIHGNLTALEAVLDNCRKQEVDKIYCLGDIVGYGPRSSECLALIRSITETIVLGNHDEMAFLEEVDGLFLSSDAKWSLKFTADHLSDVEKKFLRYLPDIIRLNDQAMVLAHSSYQYPEHWLYITERVSAAAAMKYQPEPVCFIGHTHIPKVFCKKEGEAAADSLDLSTAIPIRPNYHYIINPGSVGQPRDHDPRASYGILETIGSQEAFSLHRIEYNLEQEQAIMKKAGVCGSIIERLEKGR